MKKLLLLSLSLLFLITACQKAENILGILPDAPLGTGDRDLARVSSILPAYADSLRDNDLNQAGIQGKIEVVFFDYMAEATLTPANIKILNTLTNIEIPAADITTEYYPEIQKLFIFVDNVPASGLFTIRLVTGGITNTYGSPLDFDLDNFADGTPYDDYHSAFYTTALLDTPAIFEQPTVASFSPDTSAFSNLLPVISITFNTPLNLGMDTTTLNTSNIILEDSSGNSVGLSVTYKDSSSINLQPSANLTTNRRYYITVKCDNMRCLSGNPTPPSYFLKLDGDGDGPEATEPDLVSTFRVDDPTFSLKLTSILPITRGAIFRFSDIVDTTTISFDNIKVYDNTGFVPGEMRIYTDVGGNYTLIDYYFKRTVGGGRTGFVSKNLKGENGYFFDGDGNGIGGEPWDDRDQPF